MDVDKKPYHAEPPKKQTLMFLEINALLKFCINGKESINYAVGKSLSLLSVSVRPSGRFKFDKQNKSETLDKNNNYIRLCCQYQQNLL